MRWYELYPRVDIDYSKVSLINLLGRTFGVLYYQGEKYLHFYVNTITAKQSLAQYFGINEAKKLPSFQYYVEFLLKKERDFPYPLEVHDLHSFLNDFEKGDGLLVWAVLDNRLRGLHTKHMNRLLAIKKSRQKYNVPSEDIDAEAQIIRNKMREDLFYLRVAILGSDRSRVLLLADEFKQYVNFPVRTDGNAILGNYLLDFYFLRKRREKAIYNILYIPPKLPTFPSLYQTLWLNMNRSSLPTLVIVPNPSVVKIEFSRSAQLPLTTVERHDIMIGHLEDGTPFRLDLEDFYRHLYIVGATGSGKSTTITKLVVEMKKLTNKKKAQVVIDPNHDLARDLSIYADYYFDASIPNFAINPLQLPNVFENRKDNISLGVSIATAILEKMLGLVETAVNVKYIFQVLLTKLYEKTDNPILSDIYELVLALRNEELDLDINDEVFEKEVEALQQMPAQSFISLLSRLKPFVENEILKKVTGPSTINWDEILKDNVLVLFDTGKNKLGEIPSYLVQASIITSLFYHVLQRSIKTSDRMPILTYIDEFQNVAHLPYISEILAEARKYGMHLIMANQNLAQLEEAGVLEHVLSNTNVKFIMAQSSPRGQELAIKLDRAFSEELSEVVPNLSVGEAVVFMRARPGEKTAPVKVLIDRVDKVGSEGNAKQLAQKTAEKFTPKIEKKDSKTMLNPVLRYCEVPKPLEQYILYYIWKSPEHMTFQADLLKDLGIDREKLREIIARLQQDQYITTEKIGNKLKLQYNRGLFRLKGIVDNEEGRKIAMRVMTKYLEKGYTVVRGKQEGDIRPDLVAFLVDKSTFRPHYNEAIAIEIESPNEIEVHPEQVRRNMQKYIPIMNLFKEIHIWTSEDKFAKLKEIYDSFMQDQSIPQDYKNKVKIFSVRMKGKEKKKIETGEFTAKKQNKKLENPAKTGEFTGNEQEREQSENIITNNNDGNEKGPAEIKTVNERLELTPQFTEGPDKSKESTKGPELTPQLTRITLKDLIIDIIGREDSKYLVQINDNKYYIDSEYIEMLQRFSRGQDMIKNVYVKELNLRIDMGGADYVIPLAPA
ncbi:type IV secretion system DNA-binding domain-containing protein [Sulfolobus sp. E5-1-F]|uniref:ATP-binding protein n=1 Tax=Saccharolobus sp. E5-1-F TaxID=2663019 RepID=UPI00129584B7|nr:ATP-binding protein [Sulfolobus sp. E5-1-F]QGA54554.1 type IV secretion system DNA-binding domain-containing protein [Sulfolobus sp. E5-1-F]